jgi:hypothetical protein
MSSRTIADLAWDPIPTLAARTASWPAPLASDESDRLEVWGTADEVLARHCRLDLSGTLRIDGEPGVLLYLQDGLVYFAERTTDPELGFRLVLDGVITEDQLVHGTRLLEGGRHLGRMFANDPTIDRQLVVDEVVAYCTETVASLKGRAVSTYAFLAEEHHSSGILAWYSAEEEPGASPPLAPESPFEDDPEPMIAEAVAATLSDWLGAVRLEPLVELDDDSKPAAHETRLPRRSRFDESIPLITDAGLGEVNISALQVAMTHIRATSTATLVGRETAAPAVSADAAVATETVLGSPAERRRWMARRQR